jgi:hypothetical protein
LNTALKILTPTGDVVANFVLQRTLKHAENTRKGETVKKSTEKLLHDYLDALKYWNSEEVQEGEPGKRWDAYFEMLAAKQKAQKENQNA